jgi:hypothetical protein
MSEKHSSNCPPQVVIRLNQFQVDEMRSNIDLWQENKGLVIGSFHEKNGKYLVGFRQFPTEVGDQIIKIVNEYYEGESNAKS